jgi:hypothetical protein
MWVMLIVGVRYRGDNGCRRVRRVVSDRRG